MENYKLCRLLSKVSKKSGNVNNYAHVLMFTPEDTDILKIYIKPEQAEALKQAPKDFDINDYIEVDYNTYKRAYEPKITYGL